MVRLELALVTVAEGSTTVPSVSVARGGGYTGPEVEVAIDGEEPVRSHTWMGNQNTSRPFMFDTPHRAQTPGINIEKHHLQIAMIRTDWVGLFLPMR